MHLLNFQPWTQTYRKVKNGINYLRNENYSVQIHLKKNQIQMKNFLDSDLSLAGKHTTNSKQ